MIRRQERPASKNFLASTDGPLKRTTNCCRECSANTSKFSFGGVLLHLNIQKISVLSLIIGATLRYKAQVPICFLRGEHSELSQNFLLRCYWVVLSGYSLWEEGCSYRRSEATLHFWNRSKLCSPEFTVQVTFSWERGWTEIDQRRTERRARTGRITNFIEQNEQILAKNFLLFATTS